MTNLALSHIQKMRPYAPPLNNRRSYAGLLLDFNERTIPPVPKIKRALQKSVADNQWQCYPEYGNLTISIARYAKVPVKNILLTNGSEQGIDLVFRTFTQPGDEVIIPVPTYRLFEQFARLNGNRVMAPRYYTDGAFPLAEILRRLTRRTRLIVVCNPNNPTGTAIQTKDIVRLARAAPRAIIYVDEAYFEFCGITAVPLIQKYPNIIVSRTFSKAFGLAALRLGYLIAAPRYITEFTKVRGPYDVNMAAVVAARAALNNLPATKKYVAAVMRYAKPLVEQFFTKQQIPYLPSGGNFLLFRPPNAAMAWRLLKAAGCLVRLLNYPKLGVWLRVTIGTQSQMKQFIRTYRATNLQKYAFLDRDGTLIFEPPDTRQVDSSRQLQILPSVITGLKKLSAAGYRLIMITNQDGLGTKIFPRKNFTAVQKKLLAQLNQEGIGFTRIFVCPHLPKKRCSCRKPQTGLLQQFLRQRQSAIDRGYSLVCGDRYSDRLLARNLGLRFVATTTNGSFASVLKRMLPIK
ncbi:MAG: histidinol-phosphate transaminase [Candidatus Magasanikbacteria bacterium]|nr:histidinol-phosphate transaminase [Candidatus Magasanikbacteria bacterium]